MFKKRRKLVVACANYSYYNNTSQHLRFLCHGRQPSSQPFSFQYSLSIPILPFLRNRFCKRRQILNLIFVINFVCAGLEYSIPANLRASLSILFVKLFRFFSGKLFQTISLISALENTPIFEIPHHDRLCFISFAVDFAPEPIHCVIITARFPNISAAGLCGIQRYPKWSNSAFIAPVACITYAGEVNTIKSACNICFSMAFM